MHPASEPPHVVFEGDEVCADADRARASLAAAIETTRLPRGGWTVAVHVRTEPRAARLRAEAEISDPSGAAVARRVLTSGDPETAIAPAGTGAEPQDCIGLARAVGVWASLVLDEESAAADLRRHGAPSDAAAARAGTEPVTVAPAAGRPLRPSVVPPREGRNDGLLRERPDDVADLPGRADRGGIELILGMLLTSRTGANALVGITPSVAIEATPDVYLRPSIAAAQSFGGHDGAAIASSTWLTARFDACHRIQGRYAHDHGLALDLCAGTEAGIVYVEWAQDVSVGTGATADPGRAPTGGPAGGRARGVVIPSFALGPSIAIQGDLGFACAVALRGVAGINVIRPEFDDTLGGRVATPLWAGRIELALAWRVR